ncbi:helix-turn-helix domain-containing protein [Salinicoccus roseus]|uniref:Helix-turn-helix protein n=1 Tax=Salinicoccus roseus TaxID=45670 RepID=A0A265E6C4_9STAP|nr:helix-turn-helix domain-containing protein [Salinicoccus roseus]OZT77144.1 hypothetical protein CFN03_08700 [Salinicoccus roseus]
MDKKDMLKHGSVLSSGYGIIPKLVMKDKELTIEAKAIYAFLCSYTGKGDTAFPGIGIITSHLDISEHRFYRHRKQLIEKGYITLTKERYEGGAFKRNIYTINTSIPHEQNPHVDNLHVDNPHVDKPHVENVGTINNSSINNSINNNSNKNNNKEHARFEDFYNLYNKKKARPKAAKAFNKAISNHDWETIESGTIAYLKSIRSGDERFQAYPATFLNEERFLDDHEYVKGNLYETDGKPAEDDDFLNGL